jgi:hypothetical protein
MKAQAKQALPYTTKFTPEHLTVTLPGRSGRNREQDNLCVIFKHMSDKQHIIHYKLGPVQGGRKFTKHTSGDYYAEVGKYFDIIDALAECGNEEALAQAMIQVLHAEFSRTCRRWSQIIAFWRRGWKNKARELYGKFYGHMTEKDFNQLVKSLAAEEKLVERLAVCVVGKFDEGFNWIK